MSRTEQHITDTYSEVLAKLSPASKIKLIESLAKSLGAEEEAHDDSFYASFGAFASDKSAEEIIADIKGSRHFREKDIRF